MTYLHQGITAARFHYVEIDRGWIWCLLWQSLCVWCRCIRSSSLKLLFLAWTRTRSLTLWWRHKAGSSHCPVCFTCMPNTYPRYTMMYGGRWPLQASRAQESPVATGRLSQHGILSTVRTAAISKDAMRTAVYMPRHQTVLRQVCRHCRILQIIDFRLADDAERFQSKSKLNGFLMHKLMRFVTVNLPYLDSTLSYQWLAQRLTRTQHSLGRYAVVAIHVIILIWEFICRVNAMLFFFCKTEHYPLWLPPDDIVARGGRQELITFIESLIKNKTLPQPGAVSTMLAGPPCQDISAANPHSSKVNVMETDQVLFRPPQIDPIDWNYFIKAVTFKRHHPLQVRNNMVFPLLQAVEYFRPRYIVVEQVPAAVSTDRGSYATTVQAHLLCLGYQVCHNASHVAFKVAHGFSRGLGKSVQHSTCTRNAMLKAA